MATRSRRDRIESKKRVEHFTLSERRAGHNQRGMLLSVGPGLSRGDRDPAEKPDASNGTVFWKSRVNHDAAACRGVLERPRETFTV